MIVTTGFGYFTKDGKITDKYILPLGEHSLVGYDYVEVADQAALDAIQVYVPPIPPEESFSIDVFQGALFQALISGRFSAPSVRSEFAQVTAFATGTKQFSAMKQYLVWLQANGVITSADYTVVSDMLKQQNIDLGAY